MDIGTIGSITTVVSFALFIGIVLWAYSAGARRSFDEAEMLPFADDEAVERRGELGR